MLDGIYVCPYLPGAEAVVERYRGESDLRKPKPGMLLKAAADHDLDLSASWMIGRTPEDVRAGRAAGCRTIWITDPRRAPNIGADFVVGDLDSAVKAIEQAVQSSAQSGAENSESNVEQLLARILEKLEQNQRTTMYSDFSLAKLAGALVQMLALGLFGWGVLAILDRTVDQAFVRLLAALFAQTMALTLMLMHRQN
jgi:hypothetical protein